MSTRVLSGSANSQDHSLEASRLSEISDNIDAYVSPGWVRPINWPAIDLSSSANTVKMSNAVLPGDGVGNGNNFFTATFTGAVTVDFGDGTVTNFASGTAINYEYNYAASALTGSDAPVTLNAGTSRVERTSHGYVDGASVILYNLTGTSGLSIDRTYYVVNATSDSFQISTTVGGAAITFSGAGTATLLPYKIAVITVTPQAGQSITSITLNAKHNLANLVSGYSSGLLELVIALPGLTTLNMGSSAPLNSMRHSYLQKIHIENAGTFSTLTFQNTINAVEEIYINPSLSFSGITNGSNIFSGASKLTKLTMPSNTVNMTAMPGMFSGCRSLTRVPLFDVSKVTNAAFPFLDCVSLVELPPFEFLADGVGFGNFASNCHSLVYVAPMKITRASSFSGMFSSCGRLRKVGFFNTTGATTFDSMFLGCNSLESLFSIDINAATNTNAMFQDCRKLRAVELRGSMQNVTNTASMFSGCFSLLRVTDMNLASCTNMSSMFLSCTSLIAAPVLTNTNLVQNMASTFSGCARITSFPAYNTSSVTNFTSTFAICRRLLEGPAINTSSATTMASMFSDCPSLRRIPLYVTSSVTSMASMFLSCRALPEIPELNTSAVTTMADMFNGCFSLSRIPRLNTSSVTSFSNTFANCITLTRIPPLVTSAATNIAGMFNGCIGLKEIPALDFSAVSSAANIISAFADLRSLSRFLATGIRFTFSIANTSLSAAALNELYTNLPTITGQTVTITGNYGSTTDDPTIATAKGWTVTG